MVGFSWVSRKKVFYCAAIKKNRIALDHLARSSGASTWVPLLPYSFGSKQGRITRLAARMALRIWRRANRANLVFVHWGSSWNRRLGFDPRTEGFESIYLEDDLIGFGATQNRPIAGYLCDARGIYYDGRNPSELEGLLQAYESGSWRQDAAEAEFVSLMSENVQHKYAEYSLESPHELHSGDVLVMGQVANDAAWINTNSGVADNPDLVAKAVEILGGSGRIFFKAHPRWSGIRADREKIENMHPEVIHLAPEANFKSMLRNRPKVVVNTSGTGLDAGLAGCEVYSFGASFYSGWGATRDLLFERNDGRGNVLSFEDIYVVVNLHYTRRFLRSTFKDATTADLVAFLASRSAVQ
ncbi:hypothetical protein [Pseudohoeflea suaedae]|uniref:capsular polysaccharide export protein, LipB/KpsS family n=1 Tax=Pseudohoeflea suaedae TaxID=877384 RepID=UPI0013048B04|nr:hypothetical protein [Pseudohoeflea suaedae]